ncbi:hypothetical protein [Methylobacterium sp. J-067]|uniref:hypothetical protein n=1 Tax=Methylobacterium sp. J-067 TaxID=2836648 RepID=UPI001FB96ECF|nr:hypothetical protein [Methylobacterium sp. J-067]MCJ2025284.1 hypothetical protein [Methylobacterium sp. J-067]
MKKESKPINDEHVAAVGDQLDHALANGPAPPKARTRQALVNFHKARITAMRQAHFTMAEIAEALSVNGVVFSPAALSTYLARSPAVDPNKATAAKKTKPQTISDALNVRPKVRRQPRLEGATDVSSDSAHENGATTSLLTPKSISAGKSTVETHAERHAINRRADTRVETNIPAGGSWYDNLN